MTLELYLPLLPSFVSSEKILPYGKEYWRELYLADLLFGFFPKIGGFLFGRPISSGRLYKHAHARLSTWCQICALSSAVYSYLPWTFVAWCAPQFLPFLGLAIPHAAFPSFTSFSVSEGTLFGKEDETYRSSAKGLVFASARRWQKRLHHVPNTVVTNFALTF